MFAEKSISTGNGTEPSEAPRILLSFLSWGRLHPAHGGPTSSAQPWPVMDVSCFDMTTGILVDLRAMSPGPPLTKSRTLRMTPSTSLTDTGYSMPTLSLNWNDREAVMEYWVGAWRLLAGSMHEFDPELIRKMARADLARTPNPLTAFNHAGLGDATGWIDRLDEISQPALVIHGTDDIVLPYVHAEALNDALPHARLVKLQGVGHELPRAVWPLVVREICQHTNTGEQCSV